MSDCYSLIRTKAELLHAVLLTPTFPCSPSVLLSNSDCRCAYQEPKNFLALPLLLIHSARAASVLVGFIV